MNTSVQKLWAIWLKWRVCKTVTSEFVEFEFNLEENLRILCTDLNSNSWAHGEYRSFDVRESKRRTVNVAQIRDRLVHRLIYNYLEKVYDKTFFYDVWSCRKNKGLLGCIERVGRVLNRFPDAYFWRCDIKKFFDSVDHNFLLKCIDLRVKDEFIMRTIRCTICSYETRQGVGMPIGNLTSQIFANIYLNELDYFVQHNVNKLFYVRYGDDFVFLSHERDDLVNIREKVLQFIHVVLRLDINHKHDFISDVKCGVKFLGVQIFSNGRRLCKRTKQKIHSRLSLKNVGSYREIILKHCSKSDLRSLDWEICDII